MVYVAENAMACLKYSRSSGIVFFEKTIEELRLRGIASNSLTEALDTTVQGRRSFICSARWRNSSVASSASAPSGSCRRASGWPHRRPSPKLTDDDVEAEGVLAAIPLIAAQISVDLLNAAVMVRV